MLAGVASLAIVALPALGAAEAIAGEAVEASVGDLLTTGHGAARIAGASATRGGVLSLEEISAVRASGQVLSQADGATVRVLQSATGRFDVVVEGSRGLITTFKNLSQNSLNRLASRYGWQ